MKVNPSFILRKIADEYIIVPVGPEADRMHGVLTLNEEGAFLWELLEIEQTEKCLLDAMMENYDVDESDAMADISVFLRDLKEFGCLISEDQ